jgi:molybdopterin molybdotransferase
MQADVTPFPTGISLDEARVRIVEFAARHRLPHESISLDLALDRILASDVVAPRDVPGFVNSAMDGFALRGVDLPDVGEKSFLLLGEIFAGGGDPVPVEANGCVRITTGAPLPMGADTVVMKENTRTQGNQILISAGTATGANVRAADEDYRAGDLALSAGARLTPAQTGVLASFGLSQVDVMRKPRAILLTTGDELVAVDAPLAHGNIRDSNRYSLGGLLEQHGVTLLRHERVRDDPTLLRNALRRAGEEADIVVSSGGVSAGEADFLPSLVAQIGRVVFWKVRIKPGMPFLFGKVGNALMFGLPGNPVSGIATFLALVRPALDAMSVTLPGRGVLRARLTHRVRKQHARTEFQRVRLDCGADGILSATAVERQGSGMLRGVAEADALIVLPEPIGELAAGTVVDVLPLPGWPR